MSYIANTRFEVYVSNSKRNDLQNVTGKYGAFSSGVFTPADCSAGFIVKQQGRLPLEGYAGKLNGNSWYMVTAPNGAVIAGLPADRTGLYACNTYDVNRVTDGMGLVVNLGGKTLGLGAPAGERVDFTELLVGESYNFGAGNFTTVPTSLTATPYAVIANGLLTPAAAAPTDGSVYFEIQDISKRFIEGAYDGGAKYTLRCKRSVAVAESSEE